MSNDYAKRAGKTTLLSGKNPYIKKKIIKIMLGITCIMLLVFTAHKAKLQRQEAQQLKREEKSKASLAAKNITPLHTEQFDFYTILPNLEVSLENKNNIPLPLINTKQLEAPYIIELASFKDIGEAGKLRQQLSSLNFSAKVNSLTLNEDTWFRVYVGPFTTVVDAKAEQEKLKTFSIADGLIIKNNHNTKESQEKKD